MMFLRACAFWSCATASSRSRKITSAADFAAFGGGHQGGDGEAAFGEGGAAQEIIEAALSGNRAPADELGVGLAEEINLDDGIDGAQARDGCEGAGEMGFRDGVEVHTGFGGHPLV